MNNKQRENDLLESALIDLRYNYYHEEIKGASSDSAKAHIARRILEEVKGDSMHFLQGMALDIDETMSDKEFKKHALILDKWVEKYRDCVLLIDKLDNFERLNSTKWGNPMAQFSLSQYDGLIKTKPDRSCNVPLSYGSKGLFVVSGDSKLIDFCEVK